MVKNELFDVVIYYMFTLYYFIHSMSVHTKRWHSLVLLGKKAHRWDEILYLHAPGSTGGWWPGGGTGHDGGGLDS